VRLRWLAMAWSGAAGGAVALAAAACGARSALDVDTVASDGGEAVDGELTLTQEGGGANRGNGRGDYVYCDLYAGRVTTCDEEATTTFECRPPFPSCVFLGALWGCCGGPGPYNGPGGSCAVLPFPVQPGCRH